jgi:hypothetical protein
VTELKFLFGNVRIFSGVYHDSKSLLINHTGQSSSNRAKSALIEFSSCVQMIEVEQRVEHEEIASDSFTTVHGVIGEQNHVSFRQRYVDDCRSLCHVVAIEKP